MKYSVTVQTMVTLELTLNADSPAELAPKVYKALRDELTMHKRGGYGETENYVTQFDDVELISWTDM